MAYSFHFFKFFNGKIMLTKLCLFLLRNTNPTCLYTYSPSFWGLPRWRQCRRYKRYRFDPWVGKMPGGGHGNPLRYSCPENPMDRGAWRATVRRVSESEMIEEASRWHVPLLVEAPSPLPVYPPALHRLPAWAPCVIW